MGFLERFKNKNKNKKKKKKDEETQVYGFVSNEPGRGLSIEEAKQLQDGFLAAMHQDNISIQVNAAAKLMMGGLYAETIDAYTTLIEKYPSQRGDFEGQIGAAYFFLGEYNHAIQHYVSAREHGADAEMMDDNIWEACEALFRGSGSAWFLERYRELCPDGKHLQQASKLLP